MFYGKVVWCVCVCMYSDFSGLEIVKKGKREGVRYVSFSYFFLNKCGMILYSLSIILLQKVSELLPGEKKGKVRMIIAPYVSSALKCFSCLLLMIII